MIWYRRVWRSTCRASSLRPTLALPTDTNGKQNRAVLRKEPQRRSAEGSSYAYPGEQVRGKHVHQAPEWEEELGPDPAAWRMSLHAAVAGPDTLLWGAQTAMPRSRPIRKQAKRAAGRAEAV
jgi:hypothetical protein